MMTDLGSQEFWQRLKDNPEALAAEVAFVDLLDLEKTLFKHASLYAWVCAAHESARIAEERAEWEVTKVEAGLMIRLRAGEPDARKGGKPIDVLKAEVASHPDVEAARIALFLAMEKRGTLKAMTSALDHRKDMLVQLAARQKRERENY